MDNRLGNASELNRSVVLKKELRTKAKLAVFKSVYLPTLTYGHECWVMSEKVRSRLQAAEMRFLRGIAGDCSTRLGIPQLEVYLTLSHSSSKLKDLN